MSERSFKEDVVRAMLLVREFRLHAIAQRIDPRATRVAIKVLSHLDDHFALKKLSPKEEFDLEIYASKLAGEVIKKEAELLKKQQETTRG
jgi:hypothetical protein